MEVDWKIIWEDFWKKYKNLFPEEWELEEEVSQKVEDIWKRISPEMGRFARSELAIDNKGRVTGSMVDFILMGAILSVILHKKTEETVKQTELEELRREVDLLSEKVDELRASKK